MKTWLNNIYYSFPVQLLLLHLRSNILLLTLWIIAWLLVSGNLGQRLGFQYLFLDPEYLGDVSYWGFFFLGFSFAGFFMSWNLTTYLLTAQYFPFLASLSRPFTKFSINNSVLPLAFFAYFLFSVIYFHADFQDYSLYTVLENGAGLLSGALALIVLYAFYFQLTNRDISYYQIRQDLPPNLIGAIAPGHRKVDLDYIKLDQSRVRVRTYLNESLRNRLVRSVAHYESRMLMNIFRQNHLNALMMQLFSMLTLLVLGYLIDYEPFRIPAGASIFIFFSVVVAVIGAITYWFSEWRAVVFAVILLGINYVTSFNAFRHDNHAYGLDYSEPPALYTYDTLQAVCFSDQRERDRQATENILNNWRRRNVDDAPPNLVILCVSGGGLRAATWTLNVMQQADSLLGGRLMDHTVLITGASGGMLGMAYLRELYLRRQLGDTIDPWDPHHIDFISRDLLNSVAFSIITNDLFLPWSTFRLGDKVYYKDRGYVFEKQLNENTNFILDGKTLADYRRPEREGRIPMLYLTPSIVNDGRRMIISPQGVSFMMVPPFGNNYGRFFEVDAVDFGWLMSQHDADSLRFLTALRMNSTYPYVLPNAHLPTDPEIEVMDAGFRDNYGILSATRFIQVYQDWMRENTGKVILVQISSSEKIEKIPTSGSQGVITSLFNPLGIAGKVLTIQEFEHDNSLSFMYDLLGRDKFEVVRFFYYPKNEKQLKASVSFHLTNREKQDVLQAIDMPENQQSLRRLMELFGKSPTQAAQH